MARMDASTGGGPSSGRSVWKKLMVALLVVGGMVIPMSPAQATFPDENGRIAFRRWFNAEQTWGAIFTINPDGTAERQVTFPPKGYVDRNPDISPDGTKIAFERQAIDCDGAPKCFLDDVFVVNVDGSHLTKLTGTKPTGNCYRMSGQCSGTPAWSPDGKHIAFSRASGPVVNDLVQRAAIYIMDTDGSNVRRITQRDLPATGEDSEPQFSPDGTKLVFQRTNVRGTQPDDGIALWTIDLKTGREHRITTWRLRAGDTPDWSPDGKTILFHSNQNGPPDISGNLYTVRASGYHAKKLTFAHGGVRQYLGSSYSPDGKWIVFGRRPATGGVDANAADVFIMRTDGSDKQHVTRTTLYDSYPDWGPLTD
jgi:TolB protein